MRHAEERIYKEAHYILEHHATVRDTARVFHAGKSTVHQDVTTRLLQINPALYARVRAVLDVNLAERHVRGGQATKVKYQTEKNGSD